VIERRVQAPGVELAAVEAGQSDRPAIVLVHGYPDTKEIWLEVMERLQARFHVIAYDVRGFGGSSAPRGPAAYAYEHLASDLAAVIDTLAPGGAVHLVGHDWGGIAGWEFAGMERLDGRLRSFTTIAGPSLDQLGASLRRLLKGGQIAELTRRLYRSWYVLVLCTPGGPTLSWRGVLAGGRWSRYMRRREGLPPAAYFHRPSLAADGTHGSNLYRRNILMRLPRARRPVVARVPVQLIVPSDDHFISPDYYEDAEQFAPRLLRRTIQGTHWVPHSDPDQIAAWIAEFVEEVEAT
jgi:pimeloyl-ACP methyl ester carboxylesterase